MYEIAGGQAEYVAGESRDSSGNISGTGHAWNAVVNDGYWFLIDVTWDAGHLRGDRFVKAYSTDYLLTPPKLFAVTHFPSHDKWQLLDAPMTRGEFMRAPILRQSFHAQGLRLVSPRRSPQYSNAGADHLRAATGRCLRGAHVRLEGRPRGLPDGRRVRGQRQHLTGPAVST